MELSKIGVQNGKRVRIPIRPYVVQDFNSFIANWLSLPGMEMLLEDGIGSDDDLSELHDICHSTCLKKL